MESWPRTTIPDRMIKCSTTVSGSGHGLGRDRLARWIAGFGFGRLTGIDYPGESAGIVVPAESWSGSTVGVTVKSGLPDEAQKYLARIEELADVPIDIISTGPDREQTIVLRHPFE